jgi:hypothetical protein
MRGRRLGQALLVVAGLVNALPGIGALSAARARAAYGLDVDDRNVDVLLQHRAVLFLLTGGSLLVAVARPHLRGAALTANAVSSGSFLVIALAGGPVNPQLQRVAWVDVGVLVLLAAGAGLTARRGAPVRE